MLILWEPEEQASIDELVPIDNSIGYVLCSSMEIALYVLFELFARTPCNKKAHMPSFLIDFLLSQLITVFSANI